MFKRVKSVRIFWKALVLETNVSDVFVFLPDVLSAIAGVYDLPSRNYGTWNRLHSLFCLEVHLEKRFVFLSIGSCIIFDCSCKQKMIMLWGWDDNNWINFSLYFCGLNSVFLLNETLCDGLMLWLVVWVGCGCKTKGLYFCLYFCEYEE